jgi:hypothetical protein
MELSQFLTQLFQICPTYAIFSQDLRVVTWEILVDHQVATLKSYEKIT